MTMFMETVKAFAEKELLFPVKDEPISRIKIGSLAFVRTFVSSKYFSKLSPTNPVVRTERLRGLALGQRTGLKRSNDLFSYPTICSAEFAEVSEDISS